MSERQFLLVLIGAVATAVLGWVVVTSIRDGNTYGGLLRGMIYRDRSPFQFWSEIGIYLAFWLTIVIGVVEALLRA
jgi:hypothetical protein